MKVTISAIAREAGVSTATVDRVINGRDGVRAQTRELVRGVAERLGYALPEAVAAVTLDFVLPGGTNTYLNLLADALEQPPDLAPLVRVRVHRIEGFNPMALAAALQSLHADSRGVGLVALDHPTVREAVRDLAAAGIPILTMVSDISNVPRIGYIGIDNRASGRLAGHLLGSFIRGRGNRRKVALFAGSLSYRGHEEREMGFRHILAEDFSDLVIVQLRENLDDFERSYAEAKLLLQAHPDLAGIYNIGAGNRGIAQALEESGRGGEIVFIGHELTEHTRWFLLSRVMDAVIDQHPKLEAREAIHALARAARGQPIDKPALAIGIQVIFRENIPPR
ncbi:MAG: LacI family DNA-binding transcriptional regulator [Verrucomicrobia bacterium]|nr:LacI family DNA-binding transcriptional regulator [Verrucomicrobiota bacterium]